MVLEEEKEYKVECWLKRKHVNVEEIAGFTFMQYYKPRPSKCKPYWYCLDGLGVFIFTLKSGFCLLYTSPSPRDVEESRMPSSA